MSRNFFSNITFLSPQNSYHSCSTPLANMLVAMIAAAALAPHWALAQTAPAGSALAVTSPEPIYWKQSLFQIPYQWGSAAEPGAAQMVLLYVSKDRGNSWQKISEARPNVTSFNYRAEGEGEYWFAVRTLDHQGQSWPTGEFTPEIRVIVDTTMPQITSLRASYRPDGVIEIERTAFDQNLDPTTWRFEIQAQPTAPWQPVPHVERYTAVPPAGDSAAAVGASRVELQLPSGHSACAVRATVLDRALNMATYHASIQQTPSSTPQGVPAVSTTSQPLPFVHSSGVPAFNPPVNNPYVQSSQSTVPAMSLPAQPGHTAAAAAPQSQAWMPASSELPSTNLQQPAQPTNQPWPANTTAQAPFRLWSGGPIAAQDAVTSYGDPIGIAPPPIDGLGANASPTAADQAEQMAPVGSQHVAMPPNVQPLGPFRQASIARSPAELDGEDTEASEPVSPLAGATPGLPPCSDSMQKLPPGVQPKLVGSRTFALEYELDDAGGRGVSNVELWGTRDGGQSWRAYSRDDDNRSPLVVTVDEEGLFGFRIVVEGSGGAPAARPNTGDLPELWVAVDLHHPVAELTAIEPGSGNLANHLIFRWRAADDNLEQRPISLFYSSHPVGPWSAIATNLENTGDYTWRVERHVPTRFYVRLEARDTAGNSTAFATRDPIEFAPPPVGGRLRSAEPIDPTATGTSTSYR
jgi:hypothetical protein